MSALVKCLMQTTHSDWGQATGAGEPGSWEEKEEEEEVEVAARWSGLRLMCSFRASMEASLTREDRSAPLRERRERERVCRLIGHTQCYW